MARFPQVKSFLVKSAAVHLSLAIILVVVALAYHPVKPDPKVYTVTLVEIPPPPPPPPPPPVRKVAAAPLPKAPQLPPPPKPKAKPKPTTPPPTPKKPAFPTPTPKPTATATPTPSEEEQRRLALAEREAVIIEKSLVSPSPRAVIQPPPIRTDGPVFPYPYYLTLIQDQIASQWFPPPEVPTGVVTVHFLIQRDGSTTGLRVEKSSGSKPVDLSALRAILAVSPLPPLPEGFGGTSLGVHFSFDLSAR